MKKVLGLMLLIFGAFFLGGRIVKANSLDIYHIVTTAGEDASTSITINWHSSSSDTYVLLTTSDDTNFTYAKMCLPTEKKLWSTLDYPAAYQEDSFALNARYVNYLELNDLVPRTKYIYKIVAPNCESSIYSFLTAGLTNEWTFIALTDLQSHYNQITHPLINKLKEVSKKAPLVVCSGDLVDTAASEDEWTYIFDDENKTFSDFIFMTAPGDHEYWGADKSPVPMMKDPVTYNHFFKNPGNGASLSKNTSYYFYYNNVLFVSLDMLDSNTASSTKLDEEVTWFTETIKKLEGTYQYLVVFEHKSIYGSTENDSSVSKKIRPQWYPVFDAAKVDLVISGHDHMHSRTYRLYNNMVSSDPLLGTYYLDMGSSGNKRRDLDGTTASSGLHEKVIDIKGQGISIGASINVTEKMMLVTCYNQYGEKVDTFSIPSKREPLNLETIDFNSEEFLDNINIEPIDINNKLAKLELKDESILKNIKLIEITNKRKIFELNNPYVNYSNDYLLNDVSNNNFKIYLTLFDGRQFVLEKELNVLGGFSDLRLSIENNFELSFNQDIKSFSPLSYKISINDNERFMTNEEIENGKVILDFDLLTKDLNVSITAYLNDDLITTTPFNSTKVCDKYIILDKDILDIDVGETVLLISLNGKIEEMNDGIIEIDENGFLKVLKEGESIIKTSNSEFKLITKKTISDQTYEPEDDPINQVEDPIEPPYIEPIKEKGCKNLSIINLALFIIISFPLFILRKRFI